MQKFSGVSPQKPGVTSRTNSAGKGAPFAKGGPSGKMHSFSGTKPQKSGRSSQSYWARSSTCQSSPGSTATPTTYLSGLARKTWSRCWSSVFAMTAASISLPPLLMAAPASG
jgi:hypothetical protein